MSESGNSLPKPETVIAASKEAEKRPLDFPAAERAKYARSMVKRVQEFQKAGRPVEQIKEILPEFVRDYPQLFSMLTQPEGYDKASLESMLTLLDRIGGGSMNHHQASVIVGHQLIEKFVKPQLRGDN
jgi:hypothetical protein